MALYFYVSGLGLKSKRLRSGVLILNVFNLWQCYIHSSSRSMDLEPPPKSPIKKLCLGGSGISCGWNSSPIISGRLWLKHPLKIVLCQEKYTVTINKTHQNSVETENLCTSDGVFKNSPCPRLLKQNVLAIL